MKHFYPFQHSLNSAFLKKGKLHFALLWLFILVSQSLFSQGFKINSFLGNRCNNQSFQLVFTYDTLNAPTVPIIAELSDSTGSFGAPISLGSKSSLSGGFDTITCSFSGIPAGSNYRIRIKSNNSPPWMDTSSSFSISIPSVSFTFTNNNACAGAVVLFSNTSTGVGSLSCNWDFGTNPGSPGTSTLCFPGVSFSPPPGGGSVNYTVSLTVTDGQGCKASTTNIVTVKQNPNPLFDTANVTSTATFDQSQNLFIGDCSVTMQSPNFNFVIGNTSTTSSSITSYSINWGDGTANTILPNFVTTSHLYTQLGLFNINLTATAVNGCQFTKTYQFFNGNSPSGNLTTIPNINDCVPYTITWQVDTSTTNSNPPGTTYTFEVNDGSPIQNFTQSTLPTSISHTFTVSSCSIPPSNSFTIKFTPKNPCQPYPTTFTARPSQKPVASFTTNPSNTICTNTNVSFNNTSIGNYFVGSTCFSNFEKYWFITPATGWTLLSGQLAPSPTAINGSNNLNLSFQQPGNYQIKLRIVRSNSGGNLSRCFADSVIQTICVQPIPIPSFTLNVSPSSNCKPTLVSATNTSNTLSSCAPPVYTWTIRDSSTTGSTPVLPGTRFIFANGTDSNSINPSFQFLQKGRYIIRLRISNTCPGNFFKDTLIIIRDIPVVGLRPDIIYCGPQSLSFSSSNPAHVATYDSSFSPISSYAWSISPASGYSFVSGNASSPFPTIQFTNTTNLPITYRLILTATNACGVSNPDTQNITINPKPIVTANSLNPAFCSGGTAQITLSHNLAGGVLYGWRAYPSSPNISGFSNSSSPVSGPINQTLFNSGSTTETVTYKIAASQSSTNCFGDSSSVVVTVYPIPKVQAIAQAICSGATLSLPLNSTVSGALFTWTANSKASLVSGFSNNPTPAPGPILHTLINSSNSTVDTVRYTIRARANGCNSPDTLIQIRVSPTPVVSASNQTLCSGTQLGLNASSSVAGSSFAYTAQLISGTATGFGGGTSIPINQTLTNTGTTPALIRYSLSTTSPAPAFCPSAPVLIDVTVQPKPALSVSSTSTICSGSSTSINLSSNVTNTLYRYNATLVSGSSTFGFYSKTTDTLGPISQTLFNNGSTNAVVRYFITPRIGNCSGDSVQHEVTIIPGPIPGTIGSMGPFCSGNNAFNLQLSGSSGTIVRWEKSVAPFTNFDPIANTNAILPQSGLTQTTKYRVVINTGAGGACGSVTTPEVTVQIDSISLGGTLSAWDTVCTGTNSGNLTLSGSRGQIQSWQSASNPLGSWTNISGTANQSNYTFSNLSNTTWYKVLVKNGVCPSAISDSVRILVDQQPSNALAFDTSFCLLTAGIPITGFVRAQAISIGNGNWQFLSGPSSSSVSSPQLLSTPISNLLQGDYYFTWRVSNGKCPSKVDTAKVSIYPPLQSSIGSEQTICQGQTAATLTGLATSGGTGTYTYQWEQSTNNIIYTNINGATLSNYSPGALSSSTWFRRITRSGTCVHISSSVKITVLPSIGGNSISADQAYCIGNTSNPITGSSPTGGDGTFKYQWQRFSGGTWVNAGGADTLQNYAPGALSQTTQFRRLVTSNVCSGAQQSISNSVTHTVYPLPVVQAGADIIKCNNQPKFKLLGNPLSGTWSGPQPIVADSIDPTQYALGTYSLIYTYTNSNGCTNRDTLNFTVIAPPVVDAGSNFSICQNSPAVQLSGFNPAGGTWSGPGVSSGGLFNPSTAGAGTKQLIYSFTAGSGCNGTDTLLIMVQPKPDPGFILPVRACALDTILLSATSNPSANLASLVWSLSNNGGMSNAILGSTTAANTQAIFPENQGNTDITYTVKLIQVTNQGCSDSISKTIVHLRRPLAQFNTGNAINCGPASYSIFNTTSNVASTYLWSVNPTSNVSIVTPTTANPQVNLPVNTSNAQISYQLQLIATRNTGDLGCSDTAIANLIVYPKPQAAFTLSPNAAGCSPLPVTFTNASNPKNGESINEMSFSWTFGGLAADTNRDQNRTFFNRGGVIDSLYTVRLIATSKWGCKDTISNTVTVYPFPKADFTASVVSNCAPFAIGSSVIGLNQYPIANDTYTWHILDKAQNILSTSSGTSIPSHTLNQPNDTVYYRLITSNVHGCKPDTLIRMFRTIENPKALFSLSDSVGCHPLTINLTSQSTAGVNHAWNFGNGATSTTINPSQNFINTSFTKDTTYFVRLVVTAGTGCTDTLIKPLTVYPKPLASFNLAAKACALDTVSISNQSQFKAPAATYSWTRISPVNSLLQFSSTSSATPQLFLPQNKSNADTTYQIRLQISSVNGCMDDTIRPIIQLRKPLAQFSTGTAINCGPASYSILNTTSNVASTYLWSVNPTSNVSIVTPTAANPQLNLPVNTSNAQISYQLQLIATRNTGDLGCSDTAIANLIVYPKPQAAFTLSPNAAGCSPLPVTFTNASNPKNGESINEMSFSWTFGGLAADTNRDQNRTFFNRGGVIDSLYTVRLIATSKWGCKDTISNTVTVYPFPKADFTASVISNCAPFAIGSSVIGLNQYPIANDTYTWHILDKAQNILSTSSGTSIPSHTLNQPNDTLYYRLITSNVHGCKPDTLIRMFRTIENPKALFSLSDSVGCHPLTINLTSQSTAGVNHAWSFGNGATSTTINPSQNFINTSFTKDTTYFVRLVVTAGTGCRDTLIKSLTVYPKPFAAFSISPQACAKSVVSVVNSSQHKGSFATWNWSRMSPTQSLLQASDSTLREPQFALPDNQGTSDTSYTLRLRVTSVDGCSADTFRSFTGLRRPLAGFNLPNPNCGPVLLNSSNTTSNVGASFQWTSQPAGVSISNPNATSPSFSFPLNGSADSLNYRITLLAISSTGNCRDSIGKTVTVYPKPIASFSSNALDSCGPRRMEFINNSDPRNGEDPNSMTWNWSYLGKQIFSKHAADSFRNSGVVDSIYPVRLIVTSQHGCKDTTSKDIRVRPDAKAEFSRSLSISCAPFQITNSIISTSVFPDANSSYEWYANQSYLGSGIIFPGFILANQADSVLIKLKVLSKNGCKNDSMSLWFYTIENPKPNFIAIDSVSCSGKTVQFTNLSTPTSGLAYTWQFGSSTQSSNQSNPSFSFTNFGNTDTTVFIKLITLAGGTGCKDSLIKSIVIKPLPNPDFQLSDSVNCYPSPVLATISSGNQPPINPSTYRWVAGPTGISLLNDTASVSNSFQFTDNQSGNSNVYWVRLKVASNFGCIDSISKALRIPSRPIASFVFNPGNGCGPFSSIATSNSSYGTSYTWKDLSQQGTVNNPSASSTGISYPVHRGNLDSIYALRLIVRSNEGCLDSISKTVTVHPKPIARFVVDTSSGCAPLHINFSSNSIVKKPASLNWNFGDGSAIVISSNDSSSHTYLGSKWQDTSFTSRLIIQSADGCKDTVYKSIFVQSGAYADIVLPDTQLCSSKLNPASLLIQNNSYGSVDTFYWDFGDGQQLITTADSAIRHPYNQEGYYKITLRAKNDCRESFDSAYVLVQTPPQVQISKSDSVGCSPMKVSFSNLSTDTFRAQFFWNMGNGTSYTSFQIPEQTYLQSAVTDTFYYIRHTISNVCGSFSVLDTVRVLPLPTSYFLTNTDSGCSPLAVTVLNLSYGVPQTYNWDFGNGYISTRRNPNPDSLVYRTLDTPTVYLIKLVVSNICGSDSSFKRIKVMPNTVNSFFTADVQNGCDALTVRFTDYSSGGQNLSWNFGDGTGSTAKNPSHTFTQPGIYRVSQFVNNNCSFDTSSVLIQVYPSPAFSIAKQSKAACVEEPVQFSATLTDPGTLIWYFGDGDSSFQQNPVHRYTTSGIKIIKAVMVSALNSCTKTLWDTLLINPLPGATIIADTSRACQNEGFHFMGTTQTPAFLHWDFGDGSFGNGNSVSHYFNQAGSFSIRLVATSAAGCSDTAQKIITVYPAPDASFVMSPRDTCNGPAWVNFTNTSPGANTYLWQFHDGSSSSSINERKFYSGLGSYAIRLIATNGFLCKDTAIDSFAILDKPIAAFDFTPEDLCEGESVQFNNQSLRGKRFTWYFGDGDSSQQENPSHRYLDSGEYRVRLIAYAGSVCLDSLTASKTVKVHPKPRPSMLIQVDSTEKPVRTVSFAYTGTHGKRVSWNFGDGSESQGNQVMHKYTYGYNDSCFNVSASILSDYGCDTSLIQRICLPAYKYGLFVPNAFTPDHGIAEVREFKPVGKEIKTYHLRIFTKWGELVFESTELADGSPAKGWDGRHKDSGVPMDQGSYIWTIEAVFTNEQAWDGMLFPGASKKVKVGNVTLIR
ncbi:MAG: PKD domain-containing protein [Bacteroidetes bacterium]|nr:PKD domain-containing protein [Bacteroidota bacterium]